MNQNLELVEYLYKNSEMGVYTLTKLLEELNGKENKIKKLVEEELKEYEKFYKESKKIITKHKLEPDGNSIMAKMGSDMGIKKEVKKDNSDSSIAHMIIEGVTMGLVDIETKIKNYTGEVDGDIMRLAKNYKKALEKQKEDLQAYL